MATYSIQPTSLYTGMLRIFLIISVQAVAVANILASLSPSIEMHIVKEFLSSY